MKNVPAKKESVYEQAKSYILIGLMKNSPAIAGTSAMEIHRQWKCVLPGGLQWKILISLVSLVLAVFRKIALQLPGRFNFIESNWIVYSLQTNLMCCQIKATWCDSPENYSCFHTATSQYH